MTRAEEIKHAAHINEDKANIDSYNAFIRGAKWADEHPSSNGKELLYVAQKTADRTKKEFIGKACKWLENFLEKTIQKPSVNDGYTSDTIDLVELKRRRLIEEVLCDFKKSMEL